MANEPIYPETLPLPDESTYQGMMRAGLIRTSMQTPAPNQRKGFNTPRTELSLTFTMSGSVALLWITWANVNGWDWFIMPLVTPQAPDDITSQSRVRFTSGLSVSYRGYDLSSITVEAELIPGDV